MKKGKETARNILRVPDRRKQGHEIAINGFASLSALLMTYFGARFGVLGVYVSGRTREKLAGAAEDMPSIVAQVVKALGKKK